MKVCLPIVLLVFLLFSCKNNENKQAPFSQDTTAVATTTVWSMEKYIDTLVDGKRFSVDFLGDSVLLRVDSAQRSFKLVCDHNRGNTVRIDAGVPHEGNFAVIDSFFVVAFAGYPASRQTDILVVKNKTPYLFLSTDSDDNLVAKSEPATFHAENSVIQADKHSVLLYYHFDSVFTDKHNTEQQERWFSVTRIRLNDLKGKPKTFKIKGTGNEFADTADTEAFYKQLGKL